MAEQNSERITRLEEIVKAQGEDLAAQGGTLDHVANTVDTILIPRTEVHQEKLVRLRQDVDANDDKLQIIHDYVTSQKGAWSFITKALAVIAAGASLATLIFKILGR